jgi:hypothetical protein
VGQRENEETETERGNGRERERDRERDNDSWDYNSSLYLQELSVGLDLSSSLLFCLSSHSHILHQIGNLLIAITRKINF